MLDQAGIPVTERWYEHKPEKVVEHNNITIMYDLAIQTDRAIGANRPDIVYYNKKDRQCLLIDVAIPDDINISTKLVEKISKYKDI